MPRTWLLGLAVLVSLIGAACGPGVPTTAPPSPTAQPTAAAPAPKAVAAPSPGVAASPVASPAASPTGLPALVAVTANRDGRSISIVDATAPRVVGTVPLGRPPFAVALSPDARLAFITDNSPGASDLLVLDVPNRRLLDPISVGSQPAGVAVHERVPLAVVANMDDDSVTIFNRQTRQVLGAVPVGDRPHGVAIVSTAGAGAPGPLGTRVPEGRSFTWAYVANEGDGTVSVVDLDAQQVVETIDVGGRPTEVELARNDSRAFVLDEAAGSVHVLDVPANTVVAEIPVGPALTDLAASQSALAVLYVTAREPTRSLYRIDLTNNQVAQVFDVLGGGAAAPAPAPGLRAAPSPVASPVATGPGALAIAGGPAPGRLFVTTTEDELVVWDPDADRVAGTVTVGNQPVSAAVAAAVGPTPAASPIAQPAASPIARPAASPITQAAASTMAQPAASPVAGAEQAVAQEVPIGEPERLASMVGQTVQLNDVRVQDVIGDRAFWVGPSQDQRLFVRLEEQATPGQPVEGKVDVNTGQTVGLQGELRQLPSAEQMRSQWNLDQDALQALRGQQVYLHATRVSGISGGQNQPGGGR